MERFEESAFCREIEAFRLPRYADLPDFRLYINQLLKAVFLIPRPWVIDPEFTIVEAARAGATGYSFPSGHTQSAVCVLGMLALWVRDRVFTVLCVLGILAVAFSRMYLGVHTPLDVGVSLVTGAATVAVMPRLFDRAEASVRGRRCMAAGLMGFALLLLLYVLFWPRREANVAEFDAHGVESAWTLMVCISDNPTWR